jgi:hypothetical protein
VSRELVLPVNASVTSATALLRRVASAFPNVREVRLVAARPRLSRFLIPATNIHTAHLPPQDDERRLQFVFDDMLQISDRIVLAALNAFPSLNTLAIMTVGETVFFPSIDFPGLVNGMRSIQDNVRDWSEFELLARRCVSVTAGRYLASLREPVRLFGSVSLPRAEVTFPHLRKFVICRDEADLIPGTVLEIALILALCPNLRMVATRAKFQFADEDASFDVFHRVREALQVRCGASPRLRVRAVTGADFGEALSGSCDHPWPVDPSGDTFARFD